MADNDNCPCGSGLPFEECCEPILIGKTKARTAAALMRARYSAYALADIDFLYKSSGPKVRRDFDAAGSKKWAESSEWTGLDILSTEAGEEGDEKGVVEFVAHYGVKDKVFEHHERAEFEKIKGEWRFIDGRIIGPEPIRREEPRIGRNDPCPCGSGLKYKKCCMLKDKSQGAE